MRNDRAGRGIPRWVFFVGVATVLLALLAISRWLFLAAHSLFLVYLYRRSGNRGLLIAAAIMMGLSVGLLVESLVESPERLTSAGGVGLALIGLYVFKRQITDGPSWLWPVAGMVCLALMGLLWSAPDEAQQWYLRTYPVWLVSLFLLAAVQYWRDRRPRLEAPAQT